MVFDNDKATDGAFQFDSSTMDSMVDLDSKGEVTSGWASDWVSNSVAVFDNDKATDGASQFDSLTMDSMVELN